MVAVLQADKRNDLRGSNRRQIRQQGGVPGVVYGKTFGNEPVTVDNIALIKTIRENGRNGVFKLDIEGKKTDVMIYEIQVDPIKNEVLHADFCAVDMKSELDADVAVQVVGEAVGVKKGGVLQQALFEVSVKALPNDIPENIEVDVSELDINDTLQVKDLRLGDNFEINNDLEEVVLSILPPSDAPMEDEADAEETAEPELVEKSKGKEGNGSNEEE